MLHAVILIAVLVAVKGDGCIPRSFGGDSIVCVCNSTYCDTIDEPMLQENQFIQYMSTKDGKRMQYSVNNIVPKNELKNKCEITLMVDSNEKYQSMHGFGGAMTDSTALNIKSLTNGTQQNLLEAYFGQEGIGYTHVRIPIAGTDFSTRPYTYDDVPGDVTLSKFSLVKEDYLKIEYLHKIKDIMPNPENLWIFTTSWSAPAWMKTSNSIKWGFLKFCYYQTYADYIRKFFDAYKELGIDIWGITPGNEPLDGFIPFFTFNAMGWTPTTSANWTTYYLAPTLSKAGYNPVYMAMDDQRFEIPWFSEIMFKNEETKKLFSGTAFHWYTDIVTSPYRLTELHNKYPDKFILLTEACTGSYVWEKEKVILGSWERGEEYILDIIENCLHWVVGWVDWNMALNKMGGPNWANNFVDSPIIVEPEKDEFYKQPMFYALAHISNFVPRNSSRISLKIDLINCFKKNLEIKAIAFLTPDNKIVIVIVNTTSVPTNIKVEDKNTNSVIYLLLLPYSFNTVVYWAQK